MKLSFIIPVYNEEKTIIQVLQRVHAVSIPRCTKEILVVNDASTDSTRAKIEQFIKKNPTITLYSHTRNQGKGAGVRTGISHATGKYIIIQDADLEYDPKDVALLVKEVKDSNSVVYGTRINHLPDFKRDQRTPRFFLHYLGNRILSFLMSHLYGQKLTDIETCYKLIPKKAVEGIDLHAQGFEIEPEITAKLLKKGYKITEVSITTNPRTYNEGKKLNTFTDGWKALYTILKYRFVE